MDYMQSPLISPWIAEKGCQIARTSPTKDSDGDLDKCSYEQEGEKHVAKLKELMKPMEEVSRNF